MEKREIAKLIEDGVEILSVNVSVIESGVCGYMQMNEGLKYALKENGIDLDEFIKRIDGKINKLIVELCLEVDRTIKQLPFEGTPC